MVDSRFRESLAAYLNARDGNAGRDYRREMSAISVAVRRIRASGHGMAPAAQYSGPDETSALARSPLKGLYSPYDLPDDIEPPPPAVIDAEFEAVETLEPSHERPEPGRARSRVKDDGDRLHSGLTLMIMSMGQFPLLNRMQEVEYGRTVQECGPRYSRLVLSPGYGTASTARIIYGCLNAPENERLAMRAEFKNTKLVASRGAELLEAARRAISGEREIVQRVVAGDNSQRTRANLVRELDGLQKHSAESLMDLNPTLRRIEMIYGDLVAYAQRMGELDRMLRNPGSDDDTRRFLLDVAVEAGDVPDRFLGRMSEASDCRKQYLGARDTMTNSNLRLVVKVAKKYRGKGIPFEDLIGYGSAGLVRSVEKFNPESGYKFCTYSWWWIRQAISRAIATEGRPKGVPEKVLKTGRRIWHSRNLLTEKYGREPSDEQIAEALNLDVGDVRHSRIYEKLIRPSSIDGPITPGSEDVRAAFIESGTPDPSEEASIRLYHDDIERVLGTMDKRNAQVIRMRFGFNPSGNFYTLEECGKALGVTRERARQREAKGLRTLGRRLGKKYEALFLRKHEEELPPSDY